MPTLRRILKYTPAVVLGLLVVAWVASIQGYYSVFRQHGQYAGNLSMYNGSASGFLVGGGLLAQGRQLEDGFIPPPKLGVRSLVGRWGLSTDQPGWDWSCSIQVPFLVLTTLWLPLAVGSFTAFRFRLWHYLAYTALVAVELAYYLRWQE